MSSRHPQSAAEQRRRHYRIEVMLALRLRVAESRAEGKNDEVDSFEELSSAAARFRKELSSAGRTFVDRLMKAVDTLTGELAERRGAAGWCPRFVVEANLSAGGVGFAWDQYQAPDTFLDIEFSVSDGESSVPFRVRSLVARCEPRTDDDGFDLGVEFVDVPQATQQRLVRQILDLQRVQLRTRVRR